MSNADLLKTISVQKRFTDVIYMTNHGIIPSEIKKLFKQKKVSHEVVSMEVFESIRDRLDLIGTVVIETENLENEQQQKLAKIIETLEMENIGVVLLNDIAELPVKSFSITPSKTSFSMSGTMKSVSIDDLWVRISVNLAYRKKGTGISAKPSVPPKQIQKVYKNKLAEQLGMTGALVENLSEQLRLAGLVQQDFLPTKMPNDGKVRWSTTFLPAEWVSGDIYDVSPLDENNVGFFVADVVGHGMPAALLTIFLKQALVMREKMGDKYHIFQPSEVMEKLNRHMSRQKLSGYQFATCCYCLLNTKTMQLTFSRAGHPYPVLIQKGRDPEQLQITGSLLGIFAQAEYTQHTVQLQPGDKFMIYSDGAEPFIGYFDEKKGFTYHQEFLDIIEMPIVKMMDSFNDIAQNKEIQASEIDDITAIGFEVL